LALIWSMKNLILGFLLSFSFSSLAGISVIADMDDTIKITNSAEVGEGGFNALFKDAVFTGIPELFEGLRTYVDSVHILTASPLALRPTVIRTLNKHKIQYDSVISRNLSRKQSKLEYKVEAMVTLFEANPSDKFILLGDDVGQDPESYDEIMRRYPSRVIASYIHVVKGRSIPKTQIKYWTSYDLFLREFQSGRMPTAYADRGAELLLDEKKLDHVFPGFAVCPVTPEIWLWQLRTIFAREARDVMKKLNLYCIVRRSTIISAL
jgi:hypothetical protein